MSLTQRLVEHTLALMRIPSESGSEAAIADHVAARLAGTGARFVRRHGNAVVAGYGSPEPRLLLVGHLDTVPYNGNPQPAVEDGHLVGLGSSDMKSALGVMLALGEDFPHQDFAVIFYDCEEIAYSRNGLRPLFDAEPWLGRAEAALLMEPTDNKLELGCLGTLHAAVTFTGVAAHSARPWMGENAIHKAAGFLSRVAGLPERKVTDGPATYREVLNITRCEGGHARNVIPDRFELNANFRFAPDRSPEGAERFVRELVGDAAEVEIRDLAPAAPARADAAWFQKLAARGIESRAKQAWTDVSQFALRGVPAANFGPGIPELAHRRDERVPVENLATSYNHLASLLQDASGETP